MIPFLDLKAINAQYRADLIDAATRVIDSGWYIQGTELKAFESEFADYCGIIKKRGAGGMLQVSVSTQAKIWGRSGTQEL